ATHPVASSRSRAPVLRWIDPAPSARARGKRPRGTAPPQCRLPASIRSAAALRTGAARPAYAARRRYSLFGSGALRTVLRADTRPGRGAAASLLARCSPCRREPRRFSFASARSSLLLLVAVQEIGPPPAKERCPRSVQQVRDGAGRPSHHHSDLRDRQFLQVLQHHRLALV